MQLQTIENSTVNSARRFYFPNRKIISKRTKWNENNANKIFTLEDCRDMLKAHRETEVPVDFDYNYGNTISVFNAHGVPHIQFLRHDNTRSAPVRFTKRGWDSFTRDALPKSGQHMLRELAQLDTSGSKLASFALNKFTLSRGDEQRTFRTVEIPMENGEIGRVIRFVHRNAANAYTAVDNLELFNMLLDEPILRDCFVLDFDVQDLGMRCRLALCDKNEITDLHKYYPAMEVRNSEVGLGSVYAGSCAIKPWCDNGSHTFETRGVHRYAHRWDPKRIINGFIGARENILCEANNICKMHKDALEVAIDQMDLETFLQAELKQEKFNKSEINRVIDSGLTHPTTPQLPCLAAGIDAITVMAQEYNTQRQLEMEIASTKIMVRGLARFR